MSSQGHGDWLSGLRRYLAVTAIGHFAWEIVQLPLYTIWNEGTMREIASAVIHCTGGDVLIALASFTGAMIIIGKPGWPSVRFRRVAAVTILFGVAYTLYSEWINVSVRGSWAYAPSMPTIPLIGTGLAPTLQWIVIPVAALAAASQVMPYGGNSRRSPEAGA